MKLRCYPQSTLKRTQKVFSNIKIKTLKNLNIAPTIIKAKTFIKVLGSSRLKEKIIIFNKIIN